MSNNTETEKIQLDSLNNKNIEYQSLNNKIKEQLKLYIYRTIKKQKLIKIKDILIFTIPLIIYGYSLYYIYKGRNDNSNNKYIILYIVFIIFIIIYIIRSIGFIYYSNIHNNLTNFKYSK